MSEHTKIESTDVAGCAFLGMVMREVGEYGTGNFGNLGTNIYSCYACTLVTTDPVWHHDHCPAR